MEEQTTKLRKRKIPGWVIVLITVILTAAILAAAACLALGRSGIALVEGWLLAKYAFVDTEADLDGAVDQALGSLVSGLGDRWSYYLTEEDYQRVTTNRANNYVGVGITVNYEHEEGLFVQEITPDGPAEEAGVVAGDIIIAVDGVSIAGDARTDAVNLIQGEVGTQVTLTLLSGDGTRRDVTCTRRRLQTPSASGEMLEGNIGYVYLANFYSGSADSFRAEVDKLCIAGAQSLVIDLRNNPGGYIHELTQMLDYLLPEGPIFVSDPRWGAETVYESDEACIDLPVVVIVNADSYSAAELMAAQLRESIQAPIVGEITSGKGYSQITFHLPNGGGIGLSTATYCTGNGVSLIGTGIIPDVEIALTTSVDEQLQAALDLLNQ